ncbi:MAG: metalloregulator ArsR/SmtB family transcription factor [Actinomycetota bacterium]|nr:metalloregulator ArsR/SmtB family transcription factor [Actinomycetota bacterium]
MPAGRPIVEAEPTTLADTELLARLFRALGDGTRLRILELLVHEGELHQAEIVRRLGAVQARVSEHLGCLVWCGFVQSRVQGRRTLYRVTNREVRSLLDPAKRFLERNEAQIACCRRIDATPPNKETS